jgi:hypothetical protein
MKKLLFILFLLPHLLLGQLLDRTQLTTLNNSTVRGKVYDSKKMADMLKAIIESKVDNYLQPYGTVFTDDFNRGALGANYTKVGTTATFTMNGSTLTLGAGTGSLNEYIMRNDVKTNLDAWTMNIDVPSIGAVTGTSFGFAFGLQSQGFSGAPTQLFSLQVGFNTSTVGLGGGEIYWWGQSAAVNSGSFASYNQVSNSRLTISTNNTLAVTLERNKNVFTMTVKNVTTGYTISDQYIINQLYPYFGGGVVTPNVGFHSIYALGNSAVVLDNYVVTSNAPKRADYLLITDSQHGYFTNGNERYIDQLSKGYVGNFALYAGVGNRIEDANTAEIIALLGKVLIIELGTNNKTSGDADGVVLSKMATFVTTLQSAGYVLGSTLYVSLLMPRGAVSVVGVNTGLQAAYGNACIDNYTSFQNGNTTQMSPVFTPDQIHLNQVGHNFKATITAKKVGMIPKTNDAVFISPLYKYLQPATILEAPITFLSSSGIDVAAGSRIDGAAWYNGTNLYFNRAGSLRDLLNPNAPTLTANELAAVNGSGAWQSSDFLSTNTTKTLGLSTNGGATQTLTVNGSASNVGLNIISKGTSPVTLGNSGVTGSVNAFNSAANLLAPNSTTQVSATNTSIILGGASGSRLLMNFAITNSFYGTATLVSGTLTVLHTLVSSTSSIFLTPRVVSGTQGFLRYTVVNGVSFTITSSNAADNSTIDYLIIN